MFDDVVWFEKDASRKKERERSDVIVKETLALSVESYLD
jgi:hypothetical protein